MLDIWQRVVNNTMPVIYWLLWWLPLTVVMTSIDCCDDFHCLNILTSFNKNELFRIEDVKEGKYWFMNDQNFAVYSGNRLKSEVHAACVMPSKRTVMMLWWIRIRIGWWSSANLWQPRLVSSLETDDNSLPTNSPWCNHNQCRKLTFASLCIILRFK